MSSKERYLYLTIIAALIAVGIYMVWFRLPAANAAIERLETALAAQTQQAAQPAAPPAAPPTTQPAAPPAAPPAPAEPVPDSGRPYVLLDNAEVRTLQKQGLKDPAAQIVASLAARRDLLPMKGVLGGTMGFHPSDRWVVTRDWVIADFDDGHIAGRGLFRYTVQDGIFTWALMDWYEL